MVGEGWACTLLLLLVQEAALGLSCRRVTLSYHQATSRRRRLLVKVILYTESH